MWQAVVLFECCSKVAQRSFTGCQRLHKGCAKVVQRNCSRVEQQLSRQFKDMKQAVVLLECCSKVAQRSFTDYQRYHKGCLKVAQSLLKVVQRLCKGCKSLLAR